MKNIIERIYKRTTEYSHPSQATTTANALDLLSSGIYTEEERFIFELLQNAVDSFESQENNPLAIRIVLTENQLVFMHNGTPFSERDLEGLCDIGNGNKMNDAKKIGYKGIGFKSVFMHSHLVKVVTGKTCFKFDKQACIDIACMKGPEYKGVKMPWQIIPILTDIPTEVDTEGFNVITYIQTYNRSSLKRKVEKLLTDTRFLLFLKVDNLKITFFDGDEEILSLSKCYSGGILTLLRNDVPQNNWLIYSEEVPLPSHVKETLVHDTKTPSKLKESNSLEISFAVALDEENKILPLEDAVMYTYLPTSFSFGQKFVINANFITDAGRQQIAKDCVWNEFIFSQIPSLFLGWIAKDLAQSHTDWYKVLPRYSYLDNELSAAYSKALSEAIQTIPFVKTIDGNMVLLKKALIDTIGVHSAFPNNVFSNFVHKEISTDASVASLVSKEVGKELSQYKIASIEERHISVLLEKSFEYLSTCSDKELLTFILWIKFFSEGKPKYLFEKISYSKILIDQNNNWIEPSASFFPSEYSDKNPDITEDARIIRQSLADMFDEDLTSWFKELGVQDMSNASVIKTVICRDGFIVEGNAIKVMQFIFDNEQKEHVLDDLSENEKACLKLLTKNGGLESADKLFMDSTYGIHMLANNSCLDNFFVSSQYIRNKNEVERWQYFFQRLGVNTSINIKPRIYNRNSFLYSSFSSHVDYCSRNEKKYGIYPIHTSGYFVHIYIQAQLPPILKFTSDTFSSCRFVWSNVMAHSICLDEDKDYIAGHTGWGNYAYGYFKGHRYLGELVLPYLIHNKRLLPGTDGLLHTSRELLAPTCDNYNLCGHYLPTLDVECSIDSSWYSLIDFKKHLSLKDCLDVLAAISIEQEISIENRNRINCIYEHISDNWDFSQENSEYILLKEWSKTHKILSKDGSFEYPSSLYLLSSHLSGIEIEGQVFHAKHLENERFVAMMRVMGVNMITSHRVEGLEDAIPCREVTKMFRNKLDFLVSIAYEGLTTQEKWDEKRNLMNGNLEKLEFLQVESISVCYGNQKFSKTTYSTGNRFYFVGRFGMANQELLHHDIMKALEIPKKASTIFLTILQMKDFSEIKEYIGLKGYETLYIKVHEEVIPLNEEATIGTSMLGNEPATSEQIAESNEAKQLVLQRLEEDGFDVSEASSEYSVIHGITRDGTDYPLVVKSCKNQEHRVWINPNEWQQLFKPNSMLWLHFGGGTIAPIKAYELFTYQDQLTLSFDTVNLMMDNRINKIMEVLHYFNRVKLNLATLNPNRNRAKTLDDYLFSNNNIENSDLDDNSEI